jgi:cobalt-zinc-cadmium efflux system outer membrane protein
MNGTSLPSLAPALALLALAGCASVDPAATLAAHRDEMAARGLAPVEWRTTEAERSAAIERSRELLAAPLTPAAAVEVALLRSPALQAELAGLGVAQAELAQATRLANPGLSFSALSGGGEEETSTGLAADVVDWLTQPLRRRLGEAELERAKLEIGAAVLDLATAARVALVELQAAEALVARLATIEQIDRAAADYAQALRAAGNLTAGELAQAEAGWGETRGELLLARAEANRRREAVILALGLSGVETWSAAPLAAAPALPGGDVAALEEAAVRDRMELAAARWAVTELERARNLSRRTRWLPVGIEAGFERERDGGLTRRGPTVELALPIFDTGAAALARYGAEIERARAQAEAVEAAIRSEVRGRVSDLAAAVELAGLYRGTVLPRRLEALDATLRDYNQMLVGTFDVLIAKQEEIDAEKRAIEAGAAAWVARFELDRALGRLSGLDEGGR